MEAIKGNTKWRTHFNSLGKTKMERRLSNLSAFVGIIIFCLMFFFAISFTPDFIASKMSPDGILESRTILRISVLRVAAATIGMLILLAIIIKTNIFYSISCALSSLRERTAQTTSEKVNPSIYSMIFFMGTNRDDPFLRVRAYGEYVSSMLTKNFPEIHKILKTPDGILISLVEKEELFNIYKALN